MELKIYQVDAFANKVFEGNPAAICPLQQWLPDDVMQCIAQENNLSETAFFVKEYDNFSIRWFTPAAEVDLCGHATLACAHVIFEFLESSLEKMTFSSRSGPLTVTRMGEWLELDFPSQPPVPCELPLEIQQCFDSQPVECLKSEDYLVIFNDEQAIKKTNPNFNLLSSLDLRGVCISAKSSEYDFVCRFFAPKYGINEDPVTGSAFTQLIPYWTKALDKPELFAKQVSKRGGEVKCRLEGERVKISGKAVTYLTGAIVV